MSDRFIDGQEKRDTETNAIEERTRAMFRNIFRDTPTEDRQQTVLARVAPYLRVLEEWQIIKSDLARNILSQLEIVDFSPEDTDALVNELMQVVTPSLEASSAAEQADPGMFLRLDRALFNADGRWIGINEILFYGIDDGDLHLHLAQARDIPRHKVIGLFVGGLRELAVVIEKREDVEIISATSWIVAAMPHFFTKAGFTTIEVSDAFPNETRPVARATMSRANFLSKYSSHEL